MMIKTEYFDEQYNEVEPENARLIVQLTLDGKGIVIKRIEWTPKKKSGCFSTTVQINDDVDHEFLLQSHHKQQIAIISETQKIIKYLWKYHDEIVDVEQKCKILDTLNRSYEQLRFGLSTCNYELERKKKGGSY